MSDFNNLMDMIKLSESKDDAPILKNDLQKDILPDTQQPSIFEEVPITPQEFRPFDISLFRKELQEKSSIKNQLYRESAENINAYDVATCCILDIVYKLTNTPVENFADKWLPILLRSSIGNAIHEFIQKNSDQFSETEISMKIPSIRFSGRIDNLIGPNILVEIKSLPYTDYQKIIKTAKPRIADFYQTITYKYMLENHLQEAKDPNIKIRSGSSKPLLDKYEINQVQYIYVAHDITATDCESFSEMIKRIKDIKKSLNSKSDSFFFMTTLCVPTITDNIKKHIEYVTTKIKYINWYLDNQKLPSHDDPFIDKSKCFFCLYKSICYLHK